MLALTLLGCYCYPAWVHDTDVSMDTAASEDTDRITDTADSAGEEKELSFFAHFFGDLTIWEYAALRCIREDGRSFSYIEDFTTYTDSSGVVTGAAEFYLDDPDSCLRPYFTVGGEGGNTTDPNVLGIPGDELFLWVYNVNAYKLYPVTIDGVPFLEGGQPPPFDSAKGFEYGLEH